ncbi:MAG: hypothetical protein QJR02_11815 [Sinobacteraceae bacterium]|nr:hypothetical protein [Nevskiaceae bacterium]
MSSSTEREAILAEARSWIGTPWHHRQRVKGAGVDCINFIIGVFHAVGLAPDIDPGEYPADWHLHRDDERILNGLARYAHRVDSPRPGDIAAYRFGRCVSHAAIVEDEHYIIHAYVVARAVVRTERSALAERLHSYWSVLP